MKTPALSKKRRISFTIAMVLLPLLLLLIAELSLRLFGYQNWPPLVRQDFRFGSAKYVVNPQVAERYFSLPPELVPEAADETFAVNKSPNSLRIFCLGGSTTAGFPFEINATFPFQLRHRLNRALPETSVEVINLGISAVNSYSVLDLLPEILALEPDVLIVYMGHNEFYGAYGVGSTQSLGNHRWLILAYLKLKRLRLVQLLEGLLSGIAGWGKAAQEAGDASLMAVMAGRQAIPLHSEAVRTAADNFRANLEDIVDAAQRRGVTVLLNTLVANEKDQPPFSSDFSNELDSFTRQRCEARLLEGRSLLAAGEHRSALALLSRIVERDSTAAAVHYYRGEALWQLGDTVKAARAFSRARDHDLLRFRAPSGFNQMIREVAEGRGTPLLDMERVFRANSPGGIPGKNLFLEHLHPNFDGYRLMAQALAEALLSGNLAEPSRVGKPLLSYDRLQKVRQSFRADSAGVTALDLEFGHLRNFFLIHRWPFANLYVDLEMYQPRGSALTRELAYRHLQREIFWDGAHYELAERYLKLDQISRALREYRAVHLAFPDNYVPLMKIGDVFFAEKDYPQAARAYQDALERSPHHPHLLAKLGNTAVLANEFAAAILYLQRALASEGKAVKLDALQRVTAFYLLGVSHANLKNWTEALAALEKALQLNPDFAPARKLQSDIQRFRDRHHKP